MSYTDQIQKRLAIKQEIANYQIENERMRAQIATNNQSIIKLEFEIEEIDHSTNNL